MVCIYLLLLIITYYADSMHVLITQIVLITSGMHVLITGSIYSNYCSYY